MATTKIWLGTISPPYERPQFWRAAESKERAKQAVLAELADNWGEELYDVEWHDSGTYAYCEDSRASVEVRQITMIEATSSGGATDE